MSGGFFRGTSADQDTRFSNKQAKLLKTQKFAPELENLVDMTKVKMDVMRPWIAHRVTELLGFEDEVLINFIYGLLEEKVVNGKEIQISLTGFMEKNTGKFMKELWTHLLSAQKNASGVPQQFLDAKEEETRKKQADNDRIASELKRMKEKEKEGRELEQEKMKKMDGEVDDLQGDALEPRSRSHRASSKWSVEEKEANDRNGSRGRNRISRSPHSADRSPTSPRGTRSRSISKSFSNSRSHSRSRSLSMSPKREQRSVSSERRRLSPSRRSVTPRRGGSPQRSPYPPKRESSHLRRRSISRSRLRSPSPVRRRVRSPLRRRSRSPLRRRSRSPMWRRSRSPIRRRSRSPMRRRSRSPIRRRSRSPVRRRSRSPLRRRSRSPIRYRSRSPVGRKSRSPVRRRSLSPMLPRSPSPVRRRSPSPLRRRYRRAPSTPRHRSPSLVRRRFPNRKRSPSSESMSPSPDGQTSRSPIRRTSRSPLGRRSPRRQQRSPMRSSRDRQRIVEKISPGRQAARKEGDEQPAEGWKRSGSLGRRSPFSVRSPERDLRGRKSSHNRDPPSSSSPYRSPPSSGSPPAIGRRSPSEERSLTPPPRQRESVPVNDSPEIVEVEEKSVSRVREDKKPNSLGKMIKDSSTEENEDTVNEKRSKKKYSPERLASYRSSEIRAQKKQSEYDVGRTSYPAFAEESSPDVRRDMASERVHNSEKGYKKADQTNDSHASDIKGSARHHETVNLHKLSKKVGRNDRSGSLDSGSEETDERRGDVNEKRKRKRSKRKDVSSDDDSSNDSHVEDRKEAKRRRKEEKKLKKEEKRRRREERRRKKEDRRTEKLKLKAGSNISPPSDSENNHAGYASDGETITKRATDNEESDPKKLEIELREKALETLRAKKGLAH